MLLLPVREVSRQKFVCSRKSESWGHISSVMWSADFLFFCRCSTAVSWLCSAISVAVGGIILAPVYWNASNPLWVQSLLIKFIDVWPDNQNTGTSRSCIGILIILCLYTALWFLAVWLAGQTTLHEKHFSAVHYWRIETASSSFVRRNWRCINMHILIIFNSPINGRQ